MPTFALAQTPIKLPIVSVYDGDTIRVELNLGFGLIWRGSDNRGVEIRLFGQLLTYLSGRW